MLHQVRHKFRRGFTLIEAAMVTCIVGLGCVGMMQLLAAGTVSNASGTELTTAVYLANNIRELSLGLSFADPTTPTHWGLESGETLATLDDLDDLNGMTFSPPIDARRQQLANYPNWSQSVTVQSVDPNRLTLNSANGSTPVERLTVTVSHNAKVIYSVSWLATDTN